MPLALSVAVWTAIGPCGNVLPAARTEPLTAFQQGAIGVRKRIRQSSAFPVWRNVKRDATTRTDAPTIGVLRCCLQRATAVGAVEKVIPR